MSPRHPLRSSSALLAMLLVCACDQRRAGGSSDDIDTSVGRVAVDASGTPVPAARIVLVASGDSTGTVQAASRTDKEGRFPSFAVPDGFYGLLLRDSSGRIGRFVDSVRIVEGEPLPARDTLLALGAIHGVVRLEEGGSPATARIGLLGTNIAANVGTDGGFTVELVPGDVYTLVAATSMEGYEPLYRRIRLSEGEDLRIPDTLVIPFTGFPAPKGIRVHQDNVTGNVIVRWNRVVHPDLYGYVVQALEGGSVLRERFVQDTSFVDSLSRQWEGGDLFGPWSDRKILYRVVAKSSIGSVQNGSAAPEFTANPPAWTRSVRGPGLRFDTSATSVRLLWNRTGHPSLTGWRIERIVDGTRDCSKDLGRDDTVWTDSVCPDRTWMIVDSSYSYLVDASQSRPYLRSRRHGRVQWMLVAVRGSSPQEVDTVESRDTGSVNDFSGAAVGSWNLDDVLESAGSWLVRTGYQGQEWMNRSISQDGSNWETVDKNGLAFGSGDSIVIARMSQDSLNLLLETRTGAGAWKADSIRFDFASNRVMWGVLDKGDLVLALAREIPSWTNHNYRLVRIHSGIATILDSVIDAYCVGRYDMHPLQGGGWMYSFATPDPQVGFFRVADPVLFPWSKSPSYVTAGMNWGEPVGPWNGGKSALFFGSSGLCLFDSTGNGRVMEIPIAKKPVVIGDVLWAPIGDSLWKGTIR